MIFGVKLFTIAIALTALNPLWAATYTYEAVTDFTDINAGGVPYYRHNGVNALAINASVEVFRDKFARATLDFEHATGVYDVTIASLGEVDGDGEFRFLIDGVVVGSAVNEPATEDYVAQQHTFENINIPEGALIGVESVAVSNGTIPEGDAFAYARGRWTTLTISDVEPADVESVDEVEVAPVTPAPNTDPVELVDLEVNVSAANSVLLGEELTYVVAVENLSPNVATNVVAMITLPDGLTDLISDVCIETNTDTLTCDLVELTANTSTTFNITATAATIGNKELEVEVSADQQDDVASNNSSTVSTTIGSIPVPDDESVDLHLNITADKDQIEVGDELTYTLTVTNLHNSNTATSPAVEIALPDSLQFQASDKCSFSTQVVRCELEELPPTAVTTAQFTATAVKVNSYTQLFATASSAQQEAFFDNNDAQNVTRITRQTLLNIIPTTDQTAENTETNTTPATQAADSGGGTFQGAVLLLLLLQSYMTRRRQSLH